ncbi:methyl-accepting chemotaxis protein [Oceanicaulis sp. LC35]|uniref:methyl-accepting chemotaxis protein n=1 Tax=Oceanicaulis sp. LC35 TaxID=3349635 RepID=UPI003F8329FA
MLNKLPVAHLFGLISLGGCLLLGGVLGTAAVIESREAERHSAISRLEAVERSRLSSIRHYLEYVEEDVHLLAHSTAVIHAIERFHDAWEEMPGAAGAEIRRLYRDENPYAGSERINLVDAGDGSEYSVVHEDLHPWFRDYHDKREYADIYLFDLEGNLLYSTEKKDDFATNFLTGPYRDTHLSQVMQQVLAMEPSETALSDYAEYAPGGGLPASFMGSPVFDHYGNRLGAIVVKMPTHELDLLMAEDVGLGETGDAYLIGEDGILRTQPRFHNGEARLSIQLPQDIVQMTFHAAGDDHVIEADDWRGVHAMAIGDHFEFLGVHYGVVVTQSTHETFAVARALAWRIIITAFVVTALVAGISFLLARKVAQPIARLATTTDRISGGELQLEVPYGEATNEIGALSRALDGFRLSSIRQRELEENQKSLEAQAKTARQTERRRLADEFETKVGGVVTIVSSAATELSAASQSLSATAEETSAQTKAVSSAAGETTNNVQSVASAAEEMAASIANMRARAQSTADQARQVKGEAESTVEKVSHLTQAASRIGEVVDLIQSIAEQTNLLALNATIEAARAGEAGKGFAIVAQEVKQLASQTANATKDIADQISQIQSATGESSAAIQSVADVIGGLSATAQDIAAAVEEQAAATTEIARSAAGAADNTRNVSDNIDGVVMAATESSSAAAQVNTASSDLTVQAEALRAQVDEFLSNIRAS